MDRGERFMLIIAAILWLTMAGAAIYLIA